jgi:hypothetical protein
MISPSGLTNDGYIDEKKTGIAENVDLMMNDVIG